MRSGSASSDADIDQMDCAAESEKSSVSISTGGDAGPQMDRFSSRYACLRTRGYKLVPLTAEESAKLKSIGGIEKEEFWRELLVKNGLAPPRDQQPAPPALPAPAR